MRVLERAIEPSYNGAVLRFKLNRPTRVTLMLGTERRSYVLALRHGVSQTHRFDPGCLSPNRSYAYSLTTQNARGVRTLERGTFATQPVPDVPVDARVVRNYASLGGRPCFLTISEPIGGNIFCPSGKYANVSVDDQLRLGVRILADTTAVCPPFNSAEENNRLMHEALYRKAWFIAWRPPGRRVPLSFPELLSFPYPSDGRNMDWALESRWLYGICGTSASGLYEDAAGHRSLRMLQILIGSRARCLNPSKLNVLFWLPAVAGTRGVIFTGSVGNSLQFDVQTEIVAQARLLTDQVATFGPVLFGRSLRVRQVSSGLRVGAWRYQGSTYALAINTRQRATQGRFVLPDQARSAAVLWEARAVQLKDGELRDAFRPWGIHFYRLS